ncbi:MAG: hypothetical protein GY731_19275, partial [Gammaproteobacteria bacterium]|nr:hypothetical protein [Gammaproteobacteria bacterium]
MSEASTVTPTVPLTVRALLLFLLPLVVALIYLDSRHYDQDLLNLKASGQPSSTVAGFFPELIAGLSRTGRIQQFSRNNLYEYINGHAEFFIGAGFRALAVGEYGASSTGERPTLVV